MTQVTQHGVAGGNAVTEKRVDLAYDDLSRFSTLKRYEDLAGTKEAATSTYTFDAAGRLTDLVHAKSTTTFADYAWTYDRANPIAQFNSSADGAASYVYDNRDQLAAATYGYQSNESYVYDDNGNRTNNGYTVGANNQVLSDGTYNYLYDSEGNRTRRTTIATGDYVEYTWDHHNRLAAVRYKTSGGALTKQIEYDYDIFDRRIGKRVDATGDSVYESACNPLNACSCRMEYIYRHPHLVV